MPLLKITIDCQTENVMRQKFSLLMANHHKRVWFRYVWMERGTRCVVEIGTTDTVKSCADNWDMMGVS